MKKNPIQQDSLLMTILNSNQNTHRLTELAPFESLPDELREVIHAYCNKTGVRMHQALGVLLYGFVSKGRPIAILSVNDLDKLIAKASPSLIENKFSVRELRKNHLDGVAKQTTVWSQLWGLLYEYKIIKVLKSQAGKSPAVVEIIHPKWLEYIKGGEITDDLRLTIINSTSKTKFGSLTEFELSVPKNSEVGSKEVEYSRSLEGLNERSKEVKYIRSVNEHINKHVNEHQEIKPNDFVICTQPCSGLEVGKEYFVYGVNRERGTIDIEEIDYPSTHFRFSREL